MFVLRLRHTRVNDCPNPRKNSSDNVIRQSVTSDNENIEKLKEKLATSNLVTGRQKLCDHEDEQKLKMSALKIVFHKRQSTFVET